MDKDYSKGRYRVIGPNGDEIGRIDEDEFIRRGSTLLYRLDGAEVYLPGPAGRSESLQGFIDGGEARTPQGALLFRIEGE